MGNLLPVQATVGAKGGRRRPLRTLQRTSSFQQTARFKRTSALHGRDRVRPAVDHLLPLIEYWGTAGDDKYLLITEDSIMDTVNQHPEVDDKLDAQRDIIRQSINEIANDIGMAMRDVGLTFPVYITVRNSGDALVTIATPLDPSDPDWQQASAIVCRTLEERVGCDRLRGRELACAIANAGSINAADVTAD